MTDKQIIFNILQGEKNSIPYRPEIAREIWVIPAIILQQMIYRRNWKKFYKFTEPCEHELYKPGDSWTEELWLTKFEFTNNLKKIGFKLWKTKNQIKKEDALIIYYTDSNRLTWYELNLDNIFKLLKKCYDFTYLVNQETWFTKESEKTWFTKESEKTWFTNNTENTTKNTTNTIMVNSNFSNLNVTGKSFLGDKQTDQLSNTAPQLSNTAPQLSNTAPQPSNTAPQPSNTAPQPSNTAPQPSNTSPCNFYPKKNDPRKVVANYIACIDAGMSPDEIEARVRAYFFNNQNTDRRYLKYLENILSPDFLRWVSLDVSLIHEIWKQHMTIKKSIYFCWKAFGFETPFVKEEYEDKLRWMSAILGVDILEELRKWREMGEKNFLLGNF